MQDQNIFAYWQKYSINYNYNKTIFTMMYITRLPKFLKKLKGLSNASKEVFFDIMLNLTNDTKYLTDEEIVERITVVVEWKSRVQKQRVLKELMDIDLLYYPHNKNNYYLNIVYINPFTDKQYKQYISYMGRLSIDFNLSNS